MTAEDVKQWIDSEVTTTLRQKYASDLEALKNEIATLATEPGDLDNAIRAKGGEVRRLRSILRDLTEGVTP